MGQLLELSAGFVISFIEYAGYAGIFVLMLVESANIPVPSEVTMPFAGFLVSQGALSFWLVVFWGALGNLAGSLLSYALGYWGGRPFLYRWGKYFFLLPHEVEKGERWLRKYQNSVAFFSRLLPVVRTFISFPAGIARVNIWSFSLYTFAGSFLWSALLTYIGVWAGENWAFLEPYFRRFDIVIVVLFAVGLVWWVRKHVKHS